MTQSENRQTLHLFWFQLHWSLLFETEPLLIHRASVPPPSAVDRICVGLFSLLRLMVQWVQHLCVLTPPTIVGTTSVCTYSSVS